MVQDPFGHEGPFQRIKKKNEYDIHMLFEIYANALDHIKILHSQFNLVMD
jgi:hypothetical protein